MEIYQAGDAEIRFDFFGRDDWGKFSFPVWYGIPVKVRWRGYRFDFNLRGGWKWIAGAKEVWPDSQEMLKRTDANGLMYYGVETYASDYDLIKNFYIPYNNVYTFDLFPARRLEEAHVKAALEAMDAFSREAGSLARKAASERPRDFLRMVHRKSAKALARESALLRRIMGTELPVLPPDTIDVDYEVIPVVVTDGCDSRCRFCSFKTRGALHVRDEENIRTQVARLKDLYRDDLVNYNSVVLGQNDALAGGEKIVTAAAKIAYEGLNLAASFHKGPANLFMFGSVDPFLKAGNPFFENLNRLPFRTFINIGIESFDQETLSLLGKPPGAEKTKEAFRKMLAVNRQWQNITVSCNLVMGTDLPRRHLEGVKRALAEEATVRDRGTAFLSPLFGRAGRREIIAEFIGVKRSSHLPVYIYLAQKL